MQTPVTKGVRMKLSVPIYQLKRQAKALVRQSGVALYVALDRIAQTEGYDSWGHLAAKHKARAPALKLLSACAPGDLVLIGARPGQGKTMLGLELVVAGLQDARHAAFYSLEYTHRDVVDLLAQVGAAQMAGHPALMLDVSDDIAADHVIRRSASMPRGSVIVLDYLQLLDQNRTTAPLAEQMAKLRAFADRSGVVIFLLCQIDRHYDPTRHALPSLDDVRRADAVDVSLLSKAVFLHDGQLALQAVA